MASNSFGNVFRFTTWGESHGPSMGVVVDGCPPGLALDEGMLNQELRRRAPGTSPYTSPRAEQDQAAIQSGVFKGRTTGAPIALLIRNTNADSTKYAAMADMLRPGHANHTYLSKYGVFDYRGGGRASARETVCRVAAGAVARQILAAEGIRVGAYLAAVGTASVEACEPDEAVRCAAENPLFAPSAEAEAAFAREIDAARAEGDSVGGIVHFQATGVLAGLGDPVYERLDARLAAAMLSIPASRGFELGEGFAAALARGSAFNDRFAAQGGRIVTLTNHAGGVLGGISTGMPVWGRVAFKPTPSLFQPQETVDTMGNPATLELPPGSRHDPCVAVRAVPVVEAMCCVVLADALLQQRCTRK